MDRPTLSDDFYRRAEERRKTLAERRTSDQTESAGEGRLLPPRTPLRPRSTGLLLLTLLGVVAVVACAVSATAVVLSGAWLRGALSSPSSTAQDFYGALQRSDYTGAYQYFSSAARSQLSEPAFADQFGAYDAIDGTVTQVSIGAPQYSGGGSVAQVAVQVTRSGSEARHQVDQLRLVTEQGKWRIASISIQFGASPTPSAHS